MNNTREIYKTKLIWSGIHFFIGGFLLVGISFYIFFSWFDEGRYLLTDLLSLGYVIFSIDLILGPLFNFWLLSPTKSNSENKINLCLIIFLQIVSLSYGIHQLDGQRFAYIVNWQDSYFTILKSDDRRPIYKEAVYHFKEPKVHSNERYLYELMLKNGISPIEMFEYFDYISLKNECDDKTCDVITKFGLIKFQIKSNDRTVFFSTSPR